MVASCFVLSIEDNERLFIEHSVSFNGLPSNLFLVAIIQLLAQDDDQSSKPRVRQVQVKTLNLTIRVPAFIFSIIHF
ncbi:hypothetical protein QVD17_27889 [Tagetes erecta]|uniref:Uncharacterized protein n=1 Tax=Tagetes erecta TaxID=13708 RepID=A0AAD8NRZ9_TARER|nr:hypothetical protein QVD17_27889 [Tagetes erecta]